MVLLHNPAEMSDAEVKATFVARQRLIDELVALIERQPKGAGVQHIVIIAARGMRNDDETTLFDDSFPYD